MLKKIIIATQNKDKLKEIKKLLNGLPVNFLHSKVESPRESGKTLKENAAIKAACVAKKTKHWAIADDTGLEIDRLKGAPGVFSARFAGKGCSYSDNVNKVLKLLRGAAWKKRKATFRTVICLCSPEGKQYYAEGTSRGYITTKIKGDNGFGYDPIFYCPPAGKTFAQMPLKEKNRYSHRSRAFKNARKVICKLGDTKVTKDRFVVGKNQRFLVFN